MDFNQFGDNLEDSTNFLIEKLSFNNWWCKWHLSGIAIDSCFKSLLIIANKVYIIGIINKNIGTIKDVNVTFL